MPQNLVIKIIAVLAFVSCSWLFVFAYSLILASEGPSLPSHNPIHNASHSAIQNASVVVLSSNDSFYSANLNLCGVDRFNFSRIGISSTSEPINVYCEFNALSASGNCNAGFVHTTFLVKNVVSVPKFDPGFNVSTHYIGSKSVSAPPVRFLVVLAIDNFKIYDGSNTCNETTGCPAELEISSQLQLYQGSMADLSSYWLIGSKSCLRANNNTLRCGTTNDEWDVVIHSGHPHGFGLIMMKSSIQSILMDLERV
jgi:hypothetical protein